MNGRDEMRREESEGRKGKGKGNARREKGRTMQ